MVSLGTVLPNLMKSIRSGSDAQLVRVWELWDGAVGETIAKNARPAAFKGKLLLVEVSSSTWMHQLQFLKADIIAKINDAFGQDAVNEIKFKIGAL
jgi:predicted nucleic acid-binding Zn ribbon protein